MSTLPREAVGISHWEFLRCEVDKHLSETEGTSLLKQWGLDKKLLNSLLALFSIILFCLPF